MTQNTFGNKIASRRRELLMTQRDLAGKVKRDAAPISAAYLNDIEHDRRNPSPELVKQFAKALDIDEEYLNYLAGRSPSGQRLPEDRFVEGMSAFRRAIKR